jgi:phosphoribosylformylglycinamidine cyclo-ligase
MSQNYINHLDNYNDIMLSVGDMINSTNNNAEIVNPDIKVCGKIGDFANSVEFRGSKLIFSMDGAGTKSKFLNGPDKYYILGRDVVTHNVNDLCCHLGIPFAFMDYYGCSKLDKNDFREYIRGVCDACIQDGIALIGGETAEMKGIYVPGEVDVMGVVIGYAQDKRDIFRGQRIRVGNYLYGVTSNGAHTNGYTKIREICDAIPGGMPDEIRKYFSQPHKSYRRLIDEFRTDARITGIAHITGGGFIDNIERLFDNTNELDKSGEKINKHIKLNRWELSEPWQWLFDNSDMMWDEFIRVFNAGYGMVIISEEAIDHSELTLIGHVIN